MSSSALRTARALHGRAALISILVLASLWLAAAARAESPGVRDTAFTTATGTASNLKIETLAVQPDGKMVVGMSGSGTSTWNGTRINFIARINADGTLDTAFRANTCSDPNDAATCGPNGQVRSVSLQTDGKILVGGDFTHWNGTSGRVVNGFVRLHADGSLDTTLLGAACTVGSPTPANCHGWRPGTPGASAWLTRALQAPDGKLLLLGRDSGSRALRSWNGTPVPRLVRLNANGSIDSTFLTNISAGPDPDPVNNGPGPFGAPARDAAFQADGKTIVVGMFTQWSGVTVNGIVRLNADGSRDTSFRATPTPGLNSRSSTTALQPDGKILVGGNFTETLVRLNSDGTVDTAFSANVGTGAAGSDVMAIALQADGKILVGGNFATWNGTRTNGLVRLNADGTLNSGFVSNICIDGSALTSPCAAMTDDIYFPEPIPGEVDSIGLAADGSVLVGGNLRYWGGYPSCAASPTAATVNNIVRLAGPVVPCVPRTPAAVADATDGVARISWTAPRWTGGVSITRYRVESTTGGYACTTTTALTCDVTGLPTGSYTFNVYAVNDAGDSPAATTAAVSITGATTHTVTVTRSGEGSGTVSSAPTGIDCGATCSAPFAVGSTVVLSATPASGSTFAGWSGACSGTSTACSVTVSAAREVTATFAAVSPTPTSTSTPTPTPTPATTPPVARVTATAQSGLFTVDTRVQVDGGGVLTQVGTRSTGGRRVTTCQTRRTVSQAGTVALDCLLDARARLALRSGPIRLRLVTVFTAQDGSTSRHVRTVVVRSYTPRPEPVTG